jgi:diguanylate cyclase (GGDEF)-like protein
MTLYRQISIAILTFLLVTFAGTLYLGTANLREVYEDQLISHAQDTATSLGLTLSPHLVSGDMAVIESIISATFDHGDFLAIELDAPDGSVLVGRSRQPEAGNVPGWFVRMLSLDPPTAEALVMDGWKQGGVVRITGNPSRAYMKFWSGTLDILHAYIGSAALLLLLALIAVRYLLRPLRAIREQAEAICKRSYLVQERLPRTIELRSAVIAMNTLSEKVNSIFSEQAALTEALREQVYQDPLTGTGNRRYFDRILAALVEDQDQVSNGALLLIEMHNISRLNSTSGYTAGDELLRRAAQLLQSEVQSMENTYLARISGTGFAVIAAGMSPESADALATALCQLMYQLRADGLAHSNDICHVGIATWEHGYRTSDLISEADLALRAAQTAGQNTWQRYSTHTANQPDIYGSARWRDHLQKVIESGNIQLAIQPVYDTGSTARQVLHQEILTRIPDPGGTGINAGIFMPMAERLGLASQLDKVTINALINHMRSDTGYSGLYAVNLSSTSLHDTVFIQWMCSTLSRIPAIARRILLEFPEYGVVSNLQNVRNLVQRLGEIGCHCGIDHFGRGLSPYGYLRSLKIRYLKIDASHIRGIDTDRDSQFFIQSLTDTMHSIDIRVIAQAVETPAQQDVLVRMGVDGIQGYLIARPTALETGKPGNICQE